ncbi:MAG: DUF2207 family protein [Euzebya sp.]
MYRRRPTIDQPDLPPSTTRPTGLAPALAGALVAGGPQASALPATILDLAGKGAVDIEPERKGGSFSQATVQIRLLDRCRANEEVEAAVWSELQRLADGAPDPDVVSSKKLRKLANSPTKVRDAVEGQLRDRGWLNDRSLLPRTVVAIIGVLAIPLAVLGMLIAGIGGSVTPLVGIVVLVIVAITGIGLAASYSRLSIEGQRAAVQWTAYQAGLKQAGKDPTGPIDFDAVLPDIVAFNLSSTFNDRLKAVTKSGQPLRAFSASTGHSSGDEWSTAFPWWIAFQSTTFSSSGSGGTVSGGAPTAVVGLRAAPEKKVVIAPGT